MLCFRNTNRNTQRLTEEDSEGRLGELKLDDLMVNNEAQ